MTGKTKVMVLCPQVIDRLDEGWKIRSYYILRHLAARYDVDVLFLSRFSGGQTNVIEGITNHQILPLANDPLHTGTDIIRSFGKNVPYTAMRYYSPRIARLLRDRLIRNGHDLVFFTGLQTSVYSDAVCTRKTPFAIDFHNVETDILERAGKNTLNFMGKAAYLVTARMMRTFQIRQLRAAAFVQCVSEYDRARLEAMSGRKVVVVDNGVDTSLHQPEKWIPRCPNLLFVGSLDWMPNRDAIEFFLNKIFPSVRREIQGATLVLAGRNVHRQMRLGPAEGVIPLYNVEDIRTVYKEANIFIVPLRIGGGTRLKILEAMAHGKVVVSTPIGAEGLLLDAGKEILIAEDPDSFGKKIVSCIKNPEWAMRVAASGLAAVRERYSWEAVLRNMEHLSTVLPTPRSRP